MNELEEQIKDFLISKSVEVLNVDRSEIQWEEDLDEYGFESMRLNKLCLVINETFNIDIRPAIFLEYTSLSEFSQYLKKTYYQKVENILVN